MREDFGQEHAKKVWLQQWFPWIHCSGRSYFPFLKQNFLTFQEGGQKQPCHFSRLFPGHDLEITCQRAGQKIVKQLVLFPAEDILPKDKASSQLFCSKAKCIRSVSAPLHPWAPIIPDLMLPSCSRAKQTWVVPIFVGSGFQDLELMLP